MKHRPLRSARNVDSSITSVRVKCWINFKNKRHVFGETETLWLKCNQVIFNKQEAPLLSYQSLFWGMKFVIIFKSCFRFWTQLKPIPVKDILIPLNSISKTGSTLIRLNVSLNGFWWEIYFEYITFTEKLAESPPWGRFCLLFLLLIMHVWARFNMWQTIQYVCYRLFLGSRNADSANKLCPYDFL